ncbi:hypothetical protein J6590_005763 [Homalodisca vitripennis]|nr:hypothetical protein J6590_005763 [Homalodisca vitripennis]
MIRYFIVVAIISRHRLHTSELVTISSRHGMVQQDKARWRCGEEKNPRVEMLYVRRGRRDVMIRILRARGKHCGDAAKMALFTTIRSGNLCDLLDRSLHRHRYHAASFMLGYDRATAVDSLSSKVNCD